MKIILRSLFALATVLFTMLLMNSCASPNAGSINSASGSFAGRSRDASEYIPLAPSSASDVARSQRNESRSGLATTAGHDQYSSVQSGFFHRKAPNQPDAVDSFHYNDEIGAKTMTDALGGGRLHSGLFSTAGNRLRAGLSNCNYNSDDYPYIESNGHRIVVGKAGSAYGIHVKNNTKKRLEIVASVDGLDVLDGKAASSTKKGYVIEAGQEYVINGFRKNNSQVRQFLFGSVSDSEAAKQGQARNVGVIGLAVYEEDEAAAKAARLSEALQRAGASAFPQ
jgi:hypothetical protein